MTGKLTTLAHVKEWLGITTSTSSDDILARLIAAASRFVLSYLDREIEVRDYVEHYRGNGKNELILRQWPVVSIESIDFCGRSITTEATGNPPSNGYMVSDRRGAAQLLTLFGDCFPYNAYPITISYTAGYLHAETVTIAAEVDASSASGLTWVANWEVLDSTGAAMTEVESSPASGEYSVDDEGVYTFNAADVGASATLRFSYVPADLEQAIIELIGEKFKRKDHIGFVSKTLGGQETVTYSTRDLNSNITEILTHYKEVLPL